MEPQTLQNKPDLPPHLVEPYRAFRTLSTRRPAQGMGGINPIPFTDIQAYIQLFGTDDEEAFVTLVSMADTALINHVTKASQEKAEKAQKHKK